MQIPEGSMLVSGSYKGSIHNMNRDDIFIIRKQDFVFLSLFDGVSSGNDPMDLIQFSKEYFQKNIGGHLNLSEIVFGLNQSILNHHKLDGSYSTCTAMIINSVSGMVEYINLGDSRIYSIGKYSISLLSKDNSYGNTLTKCLGYKLERSDFISEKTNIENTLGYLLCSDGFHKIFEKEKIQFYDILSLNNLNKIKSMLRNRLSNSKDDASYLYLKNGNYV